jgi:hypothetical protein
LAVPLEGAKAFLQSAQQSFRQIGGITLVNGVLNDFALAWN